MDLCPTIPALLGLSVDDLLVAASSEVDKARQEKEAKEDLLWEKLWDR